MSSHIKIERDTFQRNAGAPSVAPSSTGTAARAGPLALAGQPLPGTSGKHPVSEYIGTAITGGKENAGTKGYLRVCRHHPTWTDKRTRADIVDQ
jgi:hypothetical protein